MNYQILIDGQEILAGDLMVVSIFAFCIIILSLYIIKIIWDKLHSGESLKYEFITIIAHKFRTPLSQIKWLTESILEKEQDSYTKESLNNLEASNKHLINLTNTLIELTDSKNRQHGSYAFEIMNICDMTGKVTDGLKSDFHEKNIFLSVQCSQPEISVKVDRPRMEFVIQTLLENAIHYSPPGRNVEIQVSREGRKAKIYIVDHGIGIDPANMNRLFSKFFRAKNAQSMDTEGFGVGLFLAQSIVQRHHGKIEVFSEGLDKGTTFVVTLPIA